MLNLTERQRSLRKQLSNNFIANVLYFVFNILVGLLLVPFFIRTLGIASYAIIPLATSMTSYVNLFAQSFNSSVSRYLTIDVQKQDYEGANIIFNTSLFSTLGIALLMLPLILIISYYSPIFFNIPFGQKQDVFILFLSVMVALLVRTITSNFGVILFAFNRLDYQNNLNTINIIVQTLLILLFFSLFSPKLSYVGYSYLLAAIINFFLTMIISKKVNPHFKVNIYDFRKSQVKDLGITGGWIIIDQIGTLLLFQMDTIVVNKLFGMTAGGEYSSILMWSALIRGAAGMLAGLITPLILTYYAKKMFEEIVMLLKSAVKIMGLVMALPIGLICGFSPFILSLWVGPTFSWLSPLMWILLSHLAINMSVLPLFSINVTYNRLRLPAIVTIISGIANLLLAVTLSSLTGWGFYGVAVALAIVITARHFFFVPFYATRVLRLSKNPFRSSLIQVLLSTLIVSGIASMVDSFLDVSTFLTLVVCCGIISLAYSLITWFIFLSQSERRILRSFIR